MSCNLRTSPRFTTTNDLLLLRTPYDVQQHCIYSPFVGDKMICQNYGLEGKVAPLDTVLAPRIRTQDVYRVPVHNPASLAVCSKYEQPMGIC